MEALDAVVVEGAQADPAAAATQAIVINFFAKKHAGFD
jgi:hypothetical protein